MRLDKLLVHAAYGSRKQVQQLIRRKQVQVNGKVAVTGKLKVAPAQDQITVADKLVHYQQFYYYMLNKPAGTLSATTDKHQKTVLALLKTADWRQDLFPVGRLDKDTTGLLMLTNDGQLAHQLLSPNQQVAKIYQATIAGLVTETDQQLFKDGITTKAGYHFQPAELTILKTDPQQQKSWIQITLREGKYHEVKRLFQAVEKEVLQLKRLQMGSLTLDPDLKAGAYRPLTKSEIKTLKTSLRNSK